MQITSNDARSQSKFSIACLLLSTALVLLPLFSLCPATEWLHTSVYRCFHLYKGHTYSCPSVRRLLESHDKHLETERDCGCETVVTHLDL